MGFWEDLYKKGKETVQNVTDTAQNVVNTVGNVANAANEGMQNLVGSVYNAATGNTGNNNMATEYDNYLANESLATTVPNTTTAPVTTPTDTTTGTTTGTTDSSTTTNPNGLTFSSEYTAQVDNLMNQIMNREKFSYDMNADAMYQQYKDIYTQQANLANQNAQAQNAALTGGYGSSYGQMVGQQAYAQQMQGLNNVGMDLYQQALNQYMMEGDQLYNQYSMLADREAQDYNRYLDERNYNYQVGRDTVADEQWNKNFEYQQGRDTINDARYEQEWAANEEQRALDNAYRNDSFAYQKEQDALNNAYRDETFAYQKEQDALSQKNYEDSFAYQKEQDALNNAYRDETFAYQKEQDALAQQNYEDSFAYQKEQDALNNAYRDETFAYQKEQDAQAQLNYENEFAYKQNQDALDNAYRDETFAYQKEQDALAQQNYEEAFAYQKEQDAQSQANWQAEFDREGEWYNDAQEASNPYTTYEGTGNLNGQSVPKQLAGVEGLTTTNTNFFDDNGYFKQAAVVGGTDSAGNPIEGDPEVGKGKMTYNIGGKEITVKTGTSPYTNTINPDAKNGVFDNGYQPDNIKGKQLTEVDGEEALVNGQWVSVYSLPDGSWYAYDAANNTYIKIDREETEGTTTPTTPTEPTTPTTPTTSTTPTTPTEPTTSNIPEPLKKFNGGPIKDASGIMEKTDPGLADIGPAPSIDDYEDSNEWGKAVEDYVNDVVDVAHGTTDVNPQPMKGVTPMMQNQGGFPDEVGEALGTVATGTNSAPAYNAAQGYGSISDLGFGPLTEEGIQELIASGTILEYPEGSGMYIKLK